MSLSVGGFAPWSEFGSIWLTWWLGDAAGALIIGPFLILWSKTDPIPTLSRPLEAGFLLATLALVGLVVFLGIHPFPEKNYPFEFLAVPVLVWAALRFSPRETAAATVVLAALAVWGTLLGTGPFTRASPNESLLLLQAFMGVVELTSLVLAAAVVARREAEESLRATEERLHLIERRRQAEEDQALLVREHEARAHAEAAVRQRDEFLSVAAHELKTPVTSLRLFAELLSRQLADTSVPDRAMRRSAEVIDRQAEKLSNLVTQLLDSTRIEAGKLLLSRHRVDISDLVNQVVASVGLHADGRLINVAAAPSTVAAVDLLRLEQVLMNLLDNAFKIQSGG
jgi:signal transduction histidine kinase